jgi:hypothetical protein
LAKITMQRHLYFFQIIGSQTERRNVKNNRRRQEMYSHFASTLLTHTIRIRTFSESITR